MSANVFEILITARDNASQAIASTIKSFAGLENQAQKTTTTITGLSGAFEKIRDGAASIFFIKFALESLAAIAAKPFDLIIGQNERLQQTLLATAASIVGVQKVLQNGVEIKDPTQAIKALGPQLDEALARIRKGSLDLVGVTSSQLTNSFQIVAQQAGAIGASLNDSADLTLKFSAAIGTLNIPIQGVRQEVNSIFQGTIDQNSQLAKTLNISNAQVANWKAQGTLVKELNNRLQPFVEGNKLAANSISGIASNLIELIENVGLAAGSNLLQPIVKLLDSIYQFLKQNQDAITSFVSDISRNLLNAFLSLSKGIGALFTTSSGAIIEGIKLAFDLGAIAINAFGVALQGVAIVLKPFFDVLATGLGLVNMFVFELKTDPVTQFTAGIIGLTIAINTGLIPSLISATVAAGSAAIAFAIAAAPLALLAAGIASITLIRYSKDLEESTAATEEFARQTNAIADSFLPFAKKLKEAKERQAIAQAQGIALSKEELALNKELQREAKNRLFLVEAQIKAVQEQRDKAPKENQGNLDVQLADLNRIKSSLLEVSNIKTENKSLVRLGGTIEKLNADLELAQKALKNPSDDSALFDKNIQSAIALNAQLREIGAKSAPDAISALEKIATTVEASAPDRIKAEQEITKIYQDESKKRTDANELAIAKAENAVQRGKLSEADAIATISKLKVKSLEEQELALLKTAETQDRIRANNFKAEEAEIVRRGELAAKQVDSASNPVEKAQALAALKLEQKNLQDARDRFRNSQLEADRKLGIDTGKLREQQEKEKTDALLKSLDVQTKAAIDAEKVSSTQRLATVAKLRKQGILLESEVRNADLAEKKKAIALELNLEQQKQAQFEKLEKSGKGVSQDVKRQNLLKIAELTKSLAETESQQIDGLVTQIRDRLTIEVDKYRLGIEKSNLALERQKLLYNALEKGLENQNRLAESAKKLNDSITSVRQAQLDGLTKILERQQKAIRDAGGTGNAADLQIEEQKLILAEKVAGLKLQALKQQQVFEKESLEREIQKRDLALERRKIENKQAIAKKQVDLAASDVDIQAAQAKLKLKPNDPLAQLELQKALLGRDKNRIELGGLVQERGFIADEKVTNAVVSDRDRQSLRNTQSGQLLGAQIDFASNVSDTSEQERLFNILQRDLNRTIGGRDGQGFARNTSAENDALFGV